jgi:murein DD-endopeptidase MepM/ murein hydrolase activator NlpD
MDGWGRGGGRGAGGGGGAGRAWLVAGVLAALVVGARIAGGPALAPVRAGVAAAVAAQGPATPTLRVWIDRLERLVRGGLDGKGWHWPPIGGGIALRPPPPPTPPMRYPVAGAILMPFGPGVDPLTGRRVQMDGLLLGALAGAPVRAPAAGRVVAVRAGPAVGEEVVLAPAGRGDVEIDLVGVAAPRVRAGDTVRRGEVVGAVPTYGPRTAAHLVLEIRVGGIPVDPLSPMFLGPPA